MKILRLVALSAFFALLGGAIGYLLLPERAPQAASVPRLRIMGRFVTPSRDPHATAQAFARSYLRERVKLVAHVTVNDTSHETFQQREEVREIEMTREEFGARVDVQLLAHLITSATDPSSAMLRNHARIAPNEPVDLPLPVRVDPTDVTPMLMELKEQVDHPPTDAKIDVEARKVIPEKPGRYLDLYGTLSRLEDTLVHGGTRVDVVVSNSQPTLTQASLSNVKMDAVVGWFETNYNADESHRDRTYNLHLAASRINGYVWMPGEVLDFNKIVGDRSEAAGFRMATVISAGELIDGVGGGTCQIAGTLHAASFFAGMEIIDRHPHSRPSGYIKMGLDATVVFPSINLKMRNTFDFPVVIHTRLGQPAGVARIELLGPQSTRTVTFIRKITDVDPFPNNDVPDASLPVGVRILTQRGIPGFRINRYRIVREGDQAVREKWEDSYPPTAQIWHVGTGGGGGKLPKPDDHMEYTADQYMAVTEAPGETRLLETRRPGTTGTAGWLVREHLTQPLPTFDEQIMILRNAGVAVPGAR